VSQTRIAFDEQGLVPAVVQDQRTGRVLMVAWMNAEAFAATRASGEAHFWSRSRRTLWKKGETSGNVMRVRQLLVDCDADTVLLLVEPAGPACHTGAPSCFFRDDLGEPSRGATEIERLEEVILARQTSHADRSYTKSLLEGGPARIGAKVREEAAELAHAIEAESPERVVAEAADVLYHALVGLTARNVRWADVLAELQRRAGTSGHDEKARRTMA
jgi:phosphoribosyl-AMP cyclohydrolase / phosphoribosyl-ATP pyrophosphohydrolase